MSEHPLTPIFEPRSVGIIGASANPEKRGHQVVAALQRSGFAGPIHPVNPRGGEILGLAVATDIGEIAEPPELVYVATPAATVPDVVASSGEAGVKGAIVPAVGFRESGADGADLERRLVEAAHATGIRVVGPNTSGLLNTHIGLHMVGGEPLAPGALAIVSQSGNIALDLMTAASARPIGVSVYVGPGNECDVGFHEILEFLGDHDPTKAIVMYVEGVADGRALYHAARDVSTKKPIVVLKGGRSDVGVKSARSHTGSVAGSYEVFRAAARQSGLFEVDASDELLAVGEALALQPAARAGEREAGFVVISDGGGHATLVADRFASLGVPLATIGDETRAALRDLLGAAASTRNPVDVAGAADRAPSILVRAVEIAAGDPNCSGVLLSGLFGGYAIRFAASLADEEHDAADGLARAASSGGVPLVLHSLYASREPAPLGRLLELGVPVHGSLEIAAICCAALSRRSGARRRAAPRIAESATADTLWMTEIEARDLLAAHGVPIVPGVFCRDEAEISALPAIDGSRALKIVCRTLPHKTDAGAVQLGLKDQDELLDAFRRCSSSAARYLSERAAARGEPSASNEIEGALVTEMLPVPLAELLVGARRDAAFGGIITLGFGGVDVELLDDMAIRVLPVSASDVEEMCRELNRGALLFGYRGQPAVDMPSLAEAVCALGSCFEADPGLVELELNPVFAYENGVCAVDAAGSREDIQGPA